jgi:hypothetical protein
MPPAVQLIDRHRYAAPDTPRWRDDRVRFKPFESESLLDPRQRAVAMARSRWSAPSLVKTHIAPMGHLPSDYAGNPHDEMMCEAECEFGS